MVLLEMSPVLPPFWIWGNQDIDMLHFLGIFIEFLITRNGVPNYTQVLAECMSLYECTSQLNTDSGCMEKF